ncbi:MAG: AAC(3) family N-acetyltransferase [Chloroflexi bacterium]|nr:AAC(3) family N-acetyltransferase [Chloroflexota bacterium]
MADQALDAKDIELILEDQMGLTKDVPIIAHVRYRSIGPVRGEQAAVVAALLAAADTVVMPAFTYQTQVIPQVGPPDNDIEYGTGDERNAKAQIFRSDMPVHPDCGSVAETLRKDAETLRSTHPILSFVAQGPRAREVLASQTRSNPLGPIAWLEQKNGAVLLIGLDHRDNVALHLAAQRAGRKTYVRWAITPDDIEELPNMPGPSDGFNQIWTELLGVTRMAQIGMARAQLVPLKEMLPYAEQRMREDVSFMMPTSL